MRRLVGLLRKRLRANGMIAGLIASILLALLFPEFGAKGGFFKSEVTTRLAVVMIFLLQGMVLPTETLRRGLLAWRLHVLTQTSIFVLLPLLSVALAHVISPLLSPPLRMGFLFLGVLPTTLATAVAFTAQAEGNVLGAMFNTMLSNLAGVLIVPAAVAAWASNSAAEFSTGQLMANIALMLGAPLVAGQLLRPLVKTWLDPRRQWVARINSALILFIVFAAICDAVSGGALGRGGGSAAALAAGGAAALLFVATWAVHRFTRLMKLDRQDAAAALFCGSQKTIAAGVPMAQSIFFGSEFAVGLVIMPLIFYHLLQLVLGVILIQRLFPASVAPPSGL